MRPSWSLSVCLHCLLQPKLHGELGSRRSLRRMGLVVLASFAFVFVVYMGSAVAGYVLKGAATKSDILLSFDEGDGPIVVARVALSVVVISCYPLAFNSLRISLVSLLPAAWAERIKAPHYALTAYEADELEDDAAVAAEAAGGVPVAAPGSAGSYVRVPDSAVTGGVGGAAATPSAAAAAGVEDSGSLGRGVSSAELTAVNGSGSGSGSPTAAGGSLVRRSTGTGAGAAVAVSVTVAGVSGSAAAAASPVVLPIPLRRPRAANQRWTLCRAGDRFTCSLPTCRALCISVRADWPHALITKVTVLISLTVAILVPNIEVREGEGSLAMLVGTMLVPCPPAIPCSPLAPTSLPSCIHLPPPPPLLPPLHPVSHSSLPPPIPLCPPCRRCWGTRARWAAPSSSSSSPHGCTLASRSGASLRLLMLQVLDMLVLLRSRTGQCARTFLRSRMTRRRCYWPTPPLRLKAPPLRRLPLPLASRWGSCAGSGATSSTRGTGCLPLPAASWAWPSWCRARWPPRTSSKPERCRLVPFSGGNHQRCRLPKA